MSVPVSIAFRLVPRTRGKGGDGQLALNDGTVELGEVAHSRDGHTVSSPNIEHLHPHEVPTALAEFLRILRPDGFLIVPVRIYSLYAL